MKIALGNDHGGYNLKITLKKHLLSEGFEVIDVGSDSSNEPSAWSTYGLLAAEKVASKKADLGIVICRSGQGVCIAANKVKGVYCGLPFNEKLAALCKQHDGCNMIALGADYIKESDAINMVDAFINAEFEGGRHQKRLEILKNYEK